MNYLPNDIQNLTKSLPILESSNQSLSVALMDDIEEAVDFILGLKWCVSIVNKYFGYSQEGIISIFFFEIDTSDDHVDRGIWIIVGDLPYAYIVTDSAKSPSEALCAYIDEMQRWVYAVQNDLAFNNIIPVSVDNKIENAENLNRRLKFLEERILPDIKESESRS